MWIEDDRTTPRTTAQDAEWRNHLSTVAAYREQCKITAQDPARPLGADDANQTPGCVSQPSTPKRQLAPAPRAADYDEPQHTTRRQVEHDVHRSNERQIDY